jgi:hypothetical protein
MAKAYLISVTEFCAFHNIEFAFISNLKEFGLVEIVMISRPIISLKTSWKNWNE